MDDCVIDASVAMVCRSASRADGGADGGASSGADGGASSGDEANDMPCPYSHERTMLANVMGEHGRKEST